MARKKVVLYNPKCVFYTMPLALLAIGSYLDPEEYEVKIIDGRLENDDHSVLLEECKDAICLGLSVLTGAPIYDAVDATQKVKKAFPDLVTVWGGWHPSLFPDETLEEESLDVIVTGQGEISFHNLLIEIAGEKNYKNVKGIYFKKDGKITNTAAQPMKDINSFPKHNYDLIPVERYFKLKKRRQLDYISSQGCRFRCSFCADPFMYNRGWYGFSPERMGDELEELWKKYKFDDVNFQDETFFTYQDRAKGIAEEFLKRGLKFTWFGTMRADQGVRMSDEVFKLCKRSGLRKVMIGVEAGSQEMLDWMKKDIKIEQVYESAEKCLRNNISIIFNVILGFPHETPESINESLRVARKLRKMSPTFELGVFYFKPYPGNAIADQLAQEGYQFPRGLKEWANFDYVGSTSDWISREQYEQIESFKFFQRVAWNKPKLLFTPFRKLAAWRCEKNNFKFPIEKVMYELIQPPEKLS
jgi:anaerobic magnesium-protoporphyrin IX monomethyl ester cyclase